MSRLIYADTFGIGNFHETFNASSLKMFSGIYEDVVYIATPSAKKCVEDILGSFPQNVRYKSIYHFKTGKGWRNLLRHIVSSLWNVYIMLNASSSSTIFFNYNSLLGMKVINWICKKRKINTIIMCHGEMEYLRTGTRLNPLNNKSLHWFQSKTFIPARNLFFCVAGQSILNNIHLIVAPQICPKFLSFEHTFISHKINTTSQKESARIKIATVGTIREFKGLDNIIKLGYALKDIKNISLYALGRICCNTKALEDAGITFIPGADKEYVDKQIMNEYIDSMDCIVFMYPTNNYKLTASGALFDAIDREKLVLSFHNEYFDGVFKRVNIGKQFDNLEEMVTYISQLKRSDLHDVNFEEAKKIISPEYEAKRFKTVLLDNKILKK